MLRPSFVLRLEASDTLIGLLIVLKILDGGALLTVLITKAPLGIGDMKQMKKPMFPLTLS